MVLDALGSLSRQIGFRRCRTVGLCRGWCDAARAHDIDGVNTTWRLPDAD